MARCPTCNAGWWPLRARHHCVWCCRWFADEDSWRAHFTDDPERMCANPARLPHSF